MGTLGIEAYYMTGFDKPAYKWNDPEFPDPVIETETLYYIHIDIDSDWHWHGALDPEPTDFCGLGGGIGCDAPWAGWNAAQVLWSTDGSTWQATGGQTDYHWDSSFVATNGDPDEGVWIQVADTAGQWGDNGGNGIVTVSTDPICWQFYARRRNGMPVRQSGPQRYPSKIYVPGDTDPESAVLVEDGVLIPRRKYELIPNG